jgi:hypothetical protein
MITLMSDRYAPITSAIGLLQKPFDDAVHGLEAWRRRLHPRVRVTQQDGPLPALLRRLEPLTTAVSPRELLVDTDSDWVAYFDCGHHGSDPFSTVGYLAEALKCQSLAIATVPHTMGTGLETPGRYGAVQFELFGPERTDFLNTVRAVSAAFDTEWRFDANGTVQDFEQVDRYAARRIRDRFTSRMLADYCAALGVRPFEEAFYRDRGALVESTFRMPPDVESMTLEQAQKLLGIVPGVPEQLPD